MSTVICIKDGDTLVLGTDSRSILVADLSTIEDDSMQKLFELGPGLFLAMAGWRVSSEFLIAKAPELVLEYSPRPWIE